MKSRLGILNNYSDTIKENFSCIENNSKRISDCEEMVRGLLNDEKFKKAENNFGVIHNQYKHVNVSLDDFKEKLEAME